MEDAADGAIGQERAHLLHRGREAPIEARHADAAAAGDVGDDGVCVLACGREGLLAEDVRAPRSGGPHDGAVQVRRRRDYDDVGMLGGEHVLPACVRVRHAVGRRYLVRGGLVPLTDRGDVGAGGLERGHVSAPEAEADDRDRGRRRGAHASAHPATPPSTTTRMAEIRPW